MSRARLQDRIASRPRPEDWSDEDPMRLEEAVAVFSDRYPMTVSTLRTEIRNGRLTPSVVAGKHFVTPAQIRALFRPVPCPVSPAAPASTFAPAGRTTVPAAPSPTSGASAMDRLSAAQAAAQATLQALSKRSPGTSPKSGRRRSAAPMGQVLRPKFS